jgi:lipopolysaccharide transport system ATP-binding protein
VAALLELGSGFNPEFTGRENVFLNASLLGLSQEETSLRFDEIAAFADIGDFIDQPVKTYSSGMMVRLAFAVQTVIEPDVLIVDEALAVGDARFQRKCYDRLARFRDHGGTVLLVTHDTGTVVQICSDALILEHGKVVDEGEPRRIAREYHRLLFDVPVEGAVQGGASESSVALGGSATKPGVDGRADQPFAERGDAPITCALPALDGSESLRREVRYGSRLAEITLIGIREPAGQPTRILEMHREYEFFLRVRYNGMILEKVAFGFIISNTRGVEVYGTKGGFFGVFMPSADEGSEFECRLRVNMRLAPGTYFLTAALAKSDEEFYDYRFDALEFKVVGTPNCFLTGLIDLMGVIECTPLS